MREAVGAAIPLAGVGCAIERRALARLAALQDGRPFAGTSMTEDYEVGLRLGALGLKTMFVRIPAQPGERASSPAAAISRRRSAARSARRRAGSAGSRFPAGTGSAGAAAWASAGCACATGAGRSRPCSCSRLMAPRLLWSQLWLAEALGAPIKARLSTRPHHLAHDQRLAARLADADARRFHHLRLRLDGRAAVGPASGRRQCHRDARRRAARCRCTSAAAPSAGTRRATSSPPSSAMRPSLRFLGARSRRLGRRPGRRARDACPAASCSGSTASEAESAADRADRSSRRSSRSRWSRPSRLRPQYPPAPYAQYARRVRYVQPRRCARSHGARSIMRRRFRLPPAPARRSRYGRTAAAAAPSLIFFRCQRPMTWPLSRLAAASMPRARSSIPAEEPPAAPPLRPRLDRLQLSSWALLRNQQTGIAGSRSLASGGQLGASQAGARADLQFQPAARARPPG